MSDHLIDMFLSGLQTHLRAALSRRDFMKTHARGALMLAAASSGLVAPKTLCAAAAPHIAVAVGDAAAATRRAVEIMGGMKAFVKKGDRVVVKPNMSFTGGVMDAVNTHPEVVREIVAMCREAGASRVRVLDHPLRPSEQCIEGARDACRIFGDDVVHALNNKEFYREVAVREGKSLRETDVMKDVLDSQVLIAAPVAKSHGSTGVSLSMKGMMGLVWNRSIMHWRHNLHDAIVDLCTVLKPSLVVVDATRVLTSDGPGGPGTVITPRTVVASRDMVAADAYTVQAFEWYGQKLGPDKVRHIRLAHERGLGRMDVQSLIVKKVVI